MPLLHRRLASIAQRLSLALLVFLYPISNRAEEIVDLYVNTADPFFSELTVCGLDANNSGYTVSVVTDEPLNEQDEQPFTETIVTNFTVLDEVKGLISVSADSLAPSGVSLIVNLIDENGDIKDSQQYTDLTTIKPSPDDFDCATPVEVVDQTPVEKVQAPIEKAVSSTDFIIDTIKGDTWHNIAQTVNIAWYSQRFTVEQVMVALYKYNNFESTNIPPGVIYPLPKRLRIPNEEYPQTITQNQLPLAANLNYIGSLKVEKPKQHKESIELKQLREEFQLLQQQVEHLTQQLSDSQRFIKLKDDELVKLRQNLVNTRERISILEQEKEELQNKSFISIINDSLVENPFLWLLSLLLLIGLLIWLAVFLANRGKKADLSRYREYNRIAQKKK